MKNSDEELEETKDRLYTTGEESHLDEDNQHLDEDDNGVDGNSTLEIIQNRVEQIGMLLLKVIQV